MQAPSTPHTCLINHALVRFVCCDNEAQMCAVHAATIELPVGGSTGCSLLVPKPGPQAHLTSTAGEKFQSTVLAGLSITG